LLTYQIARLFALDAAEKSTVKNYIDWAMDALQKGSSETSIAILAGLNPGTTYFEAKECFIQAIAELGIEEPKIEDKLDAFIETAAKEILADNIHYREFLEFARALKFERGVSLTKYDLTHLYLLQYAIEDLDGEDEYESHYYEGVNARNAAQMVKLECQILLGLLNPEASPRYAQEQRIAQRDLAGNETVKPMNVKPMELAINGSRRLPIFLMVGVVPILIWCMVQLYAWLFPG
jgi:hypothetical protein